MSETKTVETAESAFTAMRVPGPLMKEVREVIRGEYASVSEYVRSLVRADLERRRSRKAAIAGEAGN